MEDHGQKDSSGAHEVTLDVIHALTAVTLACFLLAMLYDYQYPEDDGLCAAQTTQASCTSRKMFFDPFQSQCLWQPVPTVTPNDDDVPRIEQIVHGVVVDTMRITTTDTHGSGDTPTDCRFNGSNNSTTAFMLSYLITSLFASVLNVCLDRFMVILSARQAPVSVRPVDDHEPSVAIIDDGDDNAGETTAVDGLVTAQQRRRLQRRRRHRVAEVEEETAIRSYSAATVTRQRQQMRNAFLLETTSDHDAGRNRPQHYHHRRRRNAVRAAEGASSSSPRHVPSLSTAPRRPSTEPSEASAASDTWTIVIDDDTTANKDAASVVLTVEAAAVQRTVSSVDYAVILLRLALADVMMGGSGPTRAVRHGGVHAHGDSANRRRLYLMTLYRAFPSVASLRYLWYWQVLVVGLLVVCNACVLYFLVSKAAVRGYAWQISFLKIAVVEWVSEVVLLQSLEIALFDYALCALVQREVEQAIAALVSTAVPFTGSKEAVATRWVSLEMARQWPRLLESRWVAASARLWPSSSSSRSTMENATDERKATWLSSAWWVAWLARGSFDVWETIVAFGVPLVFAWILYVYYTYLAVGLDTLSRPERSVVIAVVVVVAVAVAVAWWLWRHRYRRRTVHTSPLPVVAVVADASKGTADRMLPSSEGDNASLQWSMSSSSSSSFSMGDDGDGSSWGDDGSWRASHSDSQHSSHSDWRWSEEESPSRASSFMDAASRSHTTDEHKLNEAVDHEIVDREAVDHETVDDDHDEFDGDTFDDSGQFWPIDSDGDGQEYKSDRWFDENNRTLEEW